MCQIFSKVFKNGFKGGPKVILWPQIIYILIPGSILVGILHLIYTPDFPSYFHNTVNSPKEDQASNQPTVITFIDDSNSTIKEIKDVNLNDTMLDNLKKSD